MTLDKISACLFLRRSSVLAISAALLMLFVLSVAAYWARSADQGPAVATTAATNEAVPFNYRFIPGDRLIYKLDYTSASTSDFRVLFADRKSAGVKPPAASSGLAHSFETAIQGELVVTALHQNAGRAIIAFNLRRPLVGLQADGQKAEAEAETIKIALAREIFAEVNYRGQVLGARFDPATSSLSQSFARALLAATQFVFPDAQAPAPVEWETQEEDLNGQYLARYRAEPDANQRATEPAPAQMRMYRKTKIRYLPPDRKAGFDEDESQAIITPGGDMLACFDLKSGRLVSLIGSESQTISVAGKKVAQTKTTLNLRYLRKETPSQAELSALRAANAAREKIAAAVPLSAAESKEEREAAIQRAELGTATLDSLLADLAKAESLPDQAEAETPLYLKFKALVYLHPEVSPSLGQRLIAAEPGGLTMRILTGSLGAVDHVVAQAALVMAMQARLKDWPALSLLIPTLGAARSPALQTEEALRDLAAHSSNREIASAAQLALGAVARNLAEKSPERAARIVDDAIRQIEASSSEEEAGQLLLALGNAGSARALPVITRFIAIPSSTLRAAAAFALRWIASSQADELLTQTLSSDPDAKVRLEAAVALGFREMSGVTFEAQKRALLTDKAESVRLAVLRNLWQARDAFPEARRLVRSHKHSRTDFQ
jgi:hypothetical protein